MEDIIELLRNMDLYQDDIIFRPSSIKEDLKEIVLRRSMLIENFNKFAIEEKSEEIYQFLLRKEYFVEDLDYAQIRLGPKYFKELKEKKSKRAFIANLILGFGLGFFLNT